MLLSIVLNNLTTIMTTTKYRFMKCSHLTLVKDTFYLLAVMHCPFHILSQRWQHSQKSMVNPLRPGSFISYAEELCICMHCWVWGTLSIIYNYRHIQWDSFLYQMNSRKKKDGHLSRRYFLSIPWYMISCIFLKGIQSAKSHLETDRLRKYA